jgi:CRISPR-associated endonuclease Csn1
LETAFFTEDYTAYIKRIDTILEKKKKNPKYTVSEKFDRVSTEENELIFNYLKEKINGDKFLKMPGAHLTLGEEELEKFKNADIFGQMECISNLVLYLKTNRAGTCNMQIIGSSKGSGSLYLSASIGNWKYSDVRIVDRSASGLYETVSQNLKELL